MPALPSIDALAPAALATLGRSALGGLIYLGGLGTLGLSAIGSVLRPNEDDVPFYAALARQLASELAMGIPLVGLVHVGMGSFLSMQAYFGGTFVEGTGAVVGVGLIRNVAPLMTGMTLAGLLAARTTPELRGLAALDGASTAGPERRERLAAVRLVSGILAGLILTLWGVVVGTLVGWQVSQTILGVSTNAFFYMYFQMLWLRDVVGLLLKGTAFALFAALFACHEGLRRPSGEVPGQVPTAVCRAACLTALAILVVNSAWFLLLYHAGPAFGPTLLAPPGS